MTIEQGIGLASLLAKLSPEAASKWAAYVVVPFFIVGFAGAGVYSPGLGLDFSQPASVTVLISEVSLAGEVTARQGAVLVLEPLGADYQIPLIDSSAMWLSLDLDTVRKNSSQLEFSELGFRARTPLSGVTEPVVVVLAGKPGNEVSIPGGKAQINEWQLTSRRSYSVVSGVLFAFTFCLGIAVAASKHINSESKVLAHQNETADDL